METPKWFDEICKNATVKSDVFGVRRMIRAAMIESDPEFAKLHRQHKDARGVKAMHRVMVDDLTSKLRSRSSSRVVPNSEIARTLKLPDRYNYEDMCWADTLRDGIMTHKVAEDHAKVDMVNISKQMSELLDPYLKMATKHVSELRAIHPVDKVVEVLRPVKIVKRTLGWNKDYDYFSPVSKMVSRLQDGRYRERNWLRIKIVRTYMRAVGTHNVADAIESLVEKYGSCINY